MEAVGELVYSSSPLKSSLPGTIGGIGNVRRPPFLLVMPDETGLLLCLDCFPTGLVLRGGLGVLISSNSFTFTPGGIGKFFVRLFGLETAVLSGLFVVTVCYR